MPFHHSDNLRTCKNFELSAFNNFSRDKFYDKNNINENIKNYNARFGFNSGQPKAPPQGRTCF